MHINEINKATIPIIKSFPMKLFFDEKNLWMEAYSFSREEIWEFEKVNPDLILPEDTSLMGAAGFVEDEDGTEYEAYTVYSYNGRLFFLTINYGGEYHTYDYTRSAFIVWKD